MSFLAAIQTQYEKLNGGKAISHHPELAGRVHLVVQQYSDQVSAEMGQYADYAKVYKAYVWVHKAIAKITEAIMYLPLQVVDKENKALIGHPITDLFANVNEVLPPPELWQIWTVHMMLAGESFFELVPDSQGNPVEIWPRRPDEVKVRPDTAPERELFPRVAGYVWGDEDQMVEPEYMWHCKFYNPLNRWRGLEPIAAVREGISIDIFAQTWSKSFLRYGARPDFALIAPQGITATEKDELEAKLIEKFQGSKNWHRPVVLEQGITDIKPFSFPPKDIEWLEQRKFSRDEVGGLFGVPDIIMGYGPEKYDTEVKMKSAMRGFWYLTLIPLLGYRDASLTHFFTKIRPTLRPGEQIKTNLSGVQAIQEDIKPKIEAAKDLWGMGVPFNLLDERLDLGIGPVPGGDVAYLPFTLMGMASQGEGAQQLWSGVQTKAAVPEYGSAQHLAVWKAHAARLKPFEQRMKRQLKRDFQEQQNEVLRALRGEKGLARAWAKLTLEEKQGDYIPFSPSELLNWDHEVETFIETYQPMYLAGMSEFGQAELDLLGVGMAFDVRNPAVEAAIRTMSMRFARDINATTQQRIQEALREILVEADMEGWGIPQIQAAIYEQISQIYNVRKSDYETERIARTEMNKAANNGALEGMRQSGVVERKAWLAAIDNRTRETHIQAHERYNEQPIPLNAMFEVGGDQMLGPGLGGLPEENINCRCTVYAVIEV